MTYADINKRFTEIVAEYIAKGYIFNTGTMNDSDWVIASVDLTKRSKIVRIFVEEVDYDQDGLNGVQIVIAENNRVEPNMINPQPGIPWGDLEIFDTIQFYKVDLDENGEDLYLNETQILYRK